MTEPDAAGSESSLVVTAAVPPATDRRPTSGDLPRVAEEILGAYGEGVLRVDGEGRVAVANDEAQRVLGRSRDELLGSLVWADLREPLAPFGQACRRALTHDIPTTAEFRGATGAWFEARVLPLGGGLAVMFRDIEDRRRIAQLAASQPTTDELFRVSMEVSPNGFAYMLPIRDTTGEVVDFEWVYQNAAASRMNKQPSGRGIAGRRLLDVRPNMRHSELWQHYKRVAETGETWQGEMQYQADGLDDWFRITVVRAGDGVSFTYEASTERHKAEEARQELLAREKAARAEAEGARQRLHSLFMQAPAIVCVTRGPAHEFELANDAYRTLLSKREIVGKATRDALPELEGQGFYEIFDEVYRTGVPFHGNEMLVRLDRKGEGHLEDVYVTFVLQPYRDGEGAVSGILIFAYEVTPQVQARLRVESLAEEARAAAERERQARELAETQRTMLNHIIEQSGDGIIMADEHGVIRVFNPAAERQHGLPKQEVESPAWGKTYGLKRLDGSPLPLEETPLYQALHGREVREATWKVVRPDGEDRILRGTAVPLRGEGGAPGGAVLVTRDDTERTLAHQEQTRRARQALLIGDIGEALTRDEPLLVMLQTCADAVIRHLDGAFAGIWTLNAKDEVLEAQVTAGLALEAHNHHARVPLGQFKVGSIASEGTPLLTNDLLHDDRLTDRAWIEREGLVAFAGYPLRLDNVVLGVLAMFASAPLAPDTLDILEAAADAVALGLQRKRTEEERKTLILALERSNRELDQFAYVASHDLKAPLRGIANLSQWIEEDLSDALTAETRENMDLLRGRVHRLEGLIDGILDYSRAGRSHGKAELVNVQTVLAEVVELLAAPPTTTITIDPAMPMLLTERVPFQQVFLNLIGNAVKYNPGSGAQIRVDVTDSGEFYHFTVADNGPGIAPRYHERIWGIFQTLHARDEIEGTGIGLSVVKKIVETRGGRTWVESEEGKGATFHVLWPRRPREPNSP